MLALDLNFMLRTPLWPIVVIDSRPVGPFFATQVPVLDRHELAAGKLAALFARNASRDLFDVCELLRHGGLDRSRLRTAFLAYGGINRRDWRTVSIDDVRADSREVDQQLVPMLRGDISPARENLAHWTAELVAECKNLLSIVLPFESDEREFLDRLNDHGEIAPELLTDDAGFQATIRSHPGLLWKALNVSEHHGFDQREK